MPPDTWELAVTPRGWQLEALEQWRKHQRGIVSVVTGAGKTIFAEICILHFIRAVPSGRLIVIVPTLALIDQWYVSLREDLAVPAADIAIYSGESNPPAPSVINLMVLNTARSRARPIAETGDAFLIVDECHRAASPSNARALQGPYRATLGLSATPEREYDDGFQEYLIPSLGGIIARYDYNAALRDKAITPFDLINVAVSMTPSEQNEYDRFNKRIAQTLRRSKSDTGGDDHHLKRLLRSRARVAALASMRVPTAVRLVEQQRGARTIVFHEAISAAEEIRTLLTQRGLNTTIYHSRIPDAVRRDNLQLFRRGMFDILVSCRALDEGTNVPETTVAVVASSTSSSRQRIQRLGRVLRPAPGKTRSTVYTIYATEPEERRLLKEAALLSESGTVSWRRVRLKNG